MGLFKKKKEQSNDLKIPLESVEHTRDESSQIEIVAHQEAKAEIVEEAKKVNQHLKELLVQNGFTIKIYLAAGHTPKASKGQKTK